jgi:general secretion pathway protein F
VAAFRFEAVDHLGAARRGVLEADSARAARGQLRGQGLVPLVVEPAAPPASDRAARLTGRRLSMRELSLFTRQFAALLTAGLPLDEALSVLADQAEREYVRELVATVRAEVIAGQSLAGALSLHPRDFSELYRALIAAGEQTGKLGIVTGRLADYLDSRSALTQKIQLAFIYPGIVFVVAVGIITLLLTYVVPQVVTVFANSKQALPFLTIAMLWLSAFVRAWGIVVVIVAVAAGFLFQRLLRQSAFRLAWHRRQLRIALLGRLIRDYNTVRFVSTLAILTGASVPILRALQTAGQTLGNDVMRNAIGEAIERVSEGAPLSRALASTAIFPPTLVHLIRSGEATGNVGEMLERAAHGAELELERRTLIFTGLLEPLLILTMGVAVLLIVLAVMMPIIELNQLVH